MTHSHRLIVLLAFLLLALSACRPAPVEPVAETVWVQLENVHSVEYAGFYMAQAQGLYARRNLDVSLVSGGGESDAMAAVLNGEAAFGITTGDRILRARAAGEQVVAIGAIYRINPHGILSLADELIVEPGDLYRRSVGVKSEDLTSSWDLQLLELLRSQEMDLSRVAFIPLEGEDALTALRSGRVTAVNGVFLPQDVVMARLAGLNVNMLYPADYGVLVYPNVLFTTAEQAYSNSEFVARFVQATFQGYQEALAQPEVAVDLALAAGAQGLEDVPPREAQAAMMEAQIPLMDIGNDRLGMMGLTVWESTQDMLLSQGVISPAIELYSAYTNVFLLEEEE